MPNTSSLLAGETRAYKTGDATRALLHDTTPDELPVFLSNLGAHRNLSRLQLRRHSDVGATWNRTSHVQPDEWISSAVACLLRDGKNTFEIPYSIDTETSEGKQRVISLPHIRSQWRYALFLHENSDKVIYYCSLSPASLRAPKGVGRDVVGTVTADDDDESPSLPHSFDATDDKAGVVELTARVWVDRFFIYRGVRRLYKFFDSADFIRLEERFPILEMLDVQAAFPSIYTHSLAWAVRGKPHAKTHIAGPKVGSADVRVRPFGEEFDIVMQKSNWKETNGILIGPEVSRVFAEIIFQRVDVDVMNLADEQLAQVGLAGRERSYCLLRYVDDYFVFSKSMTVTKVVRSCLAKVLNKYKLRLNDAKVETLERPFLNAHGHFSHDLTDLIGEKLEELRKLAAHVREKSDDRRSRRTFSRFERWKGRFLREIRVASKLHGSGVSLAVSRVPAALRERAFTLLKGLESVDRDEAALRADEAWVLVDLCGYMLAQRMTEAAAVSFCAALLVCIRLN